ncbi:unnamed protein product [Tuber melanosporum]|uniref:(Perigord truffle) hypothetical protein n=1 Tax=Tuber melanosporum (strain Mel28) TaxID=656061 RepID=D5G9N9_TUBMM|nr:uncharacterized protein GSTUM_00004999001 [Tuber melanosporum]CAZ81232.1 unnamed protein product [Tuber melanosporum]
MCIEDYVLTEVLGLFGECGLPLTFLCLILCFRFFFGLFFLLFLIAYEYHRFHLIKPSHHGVDFNNIQSIGESR